MQRNTPSEIGLVAAEDLTSVGDSPFFGAIILSRRRRNELNWFPLEQDLIVESTKSAKSILIGERSFGGNTPLQALMSEFA